MNEGKQPAKVLIAPGAERVADCAKRGNLTGIKELIAKHPKLAHSHDMTQRTPLHWAATAGHPGTTEFLLSQPGIKIDAQDIGGKNTPLHLAAARGRPNICKILLKAGASRTLKNKDGKTPEECAVNMDTKIAFAGPIQLEPSGTDSDDESD